MRKSKTKKTFSHYAKQLIPLMKKRYQTKSVVAQQRVLQKKLLDKLCKCIKRIPSNEEMSVAICTKKLFLNNGLKRGKFTCKKKPKRDIIISLK